MKRKRIEWKLRHRSLLLGDRTLIMGILNVTPDSFSDGGRFMDPDRAYARAIELEDAGADIIDIGAESTRPGSARISEEEELRRLIPVLQRLKGKLSVPVSVDTYKAAVAERALDNGAEIINDPSGLVFDAQIARVVSNANAGLVINHMRGTPETWAKLPPIKDPAGAVAAELEAAIHRAARSGVDRQRIVIDPGLGFGKRREQNAELLARLPELATIGLGVLTGPSRKSFLARETERETALATAAAVTASILNGAHIVRVHDVAEMKPAIDVADAIYGFYPDTPAFVLSTLTPELFDKLRVAANENGKSIHQQAIQFIEAGASGRYAPRRFAPAPPPSRPAPGDGRQGREGRDMRDTRPPRRPRDTRGEQRGDVPPLLKKRMETKPRGGARPKPD